MNVVDEDGSFRIPLYHGTSSLFLDSINSSGLGAADPIEQYRAIEFLRVLLVTADQLFASDQDWQNCRFAVQWIADQVCFGKTANFQHGDTYLTPSRSAAVGYALTNQFGSELITQAHRMYGFLRDHRPDVLEERHLKEHPLIALFGRERRPVLVTARDVLVANVAGEDDGPPGESIEQLESLWKLPGLSDIVLNLNFRLRKPLPPGSFVVEHLDVNRESNPFDW